MAMTTVHIQVAISKAYIDILNRMVNRLQSDNKVTVMDLVPFVVTCAAALECLLNEAIIKYSSDEFGPDGYRRSAEALISMTFRGKLDLVVPLLSKGRFIFQNDSKVYLTLVRIISLRNTLMHNKPFLEKHEADIVTDSERRPNATIYIDTLNKYGFAIEFHTCIDFWEAIKAFGELLTSQDKWQENSIITFNSEQP
jgi:hypothetical protein